MIRKIEQISQGRLAEKGKKLNAPYTFRQSFVVYCKFQISSYVTEKLIASYKESCSLL